MVECDLQTVGRIRCGSTQVVWSHPGRGKYRVGSVLECWWANVRCEVPSSPSVKSACQSDMPQRSAKKPNLNISSQVTAKQKCKIPYLYCRLSNTEKGSWVNRFFVASITSLTSKRGKIVNGTRFVCLNLNQNDVSLLFVPLLLGHSSFLCCHARK